jgi:hypothetical protein
MFLKGYGDSGLGTRLDTDVLEILKSNVDLVQIPGSLHFSSPAAAVSQDYDHVEICI